MKTEMEIKETLQGEELHYKRLLELPEHMQYGSNISYMEGWVKALRWVLKEKDEINRGNQRSPQEVLGTKP